MVGITGDVFLPFSSQQRALENFSVDVREALLRKKEKTRKRVYASPRIKPRLVVVGLWKVRKKDPHGRDLMLHREEKRS